MVSFTGRAKILFIIVQSYLCRQKERPKSLLQITFFISNLFGDVGNQIQNFVGVAGFVVVPGNQFHEVVVQCDTRFSIEHGSANFAVEVGRNNVVFGVTPERLSYAPSEAALMAFLISS